jgi:hypothetical protein
VELGILLGIIYGNRYELAASFRELSGYSREFLRRFIGPVLPVIVNEILWAVGVSMYTFFYGMQGVMATTTAQIMEVMHGLFFSIFFGLGSSCGVMIGNQIGAGNEDLARVYAKRSIVLGIGLGLVMGLALAVGAPLFLSFFKVSPDILHACRLAAYVFAGTMFIRVINLIMVVGVCRNGGDTVFAALIDVLSPWCVGIPMAALGVLVLKWPIYLVMALVSLEEVVKAGFGIWRLLSGKWLNNLVRDLHGGEVETGLNRKEMRTAKTRRRQERKCSSSRIGVKQLGCAGVQASCLGNLSLSLQSLRAFATTRGRNKNYKTIDRDEGDEGDEGDESKNKDVLFFSVSPSSPSSLLKCFSFAFSSLRGWIHAHRLIG